MIVLFLLHLVFQLISGMKTIYPMAEHVSTHQLARYSIQLQHGVCFCAFLRAVQVFSHLHSISLKVAPLARQDPHPCLSTWPKDREWELAVEQTILST